MNQINYIYRFDIAAAILTFVFLIRFFYGRKISTKLTSSFASLTTLVMTSSIFDILSIIHLAKSATVPLWVNSLFILLYDITYQSIPLAFYICLSLMANGFSVRNKFITYAVHLPYFITLFLILTSPFTKFIYYFDENLFYHRGPLHFILYIQCSLYIGAGILRYLHNFKKFTKAQNFTVIFFTSICGLSVVLQLLLPHLMIMNFAISISIIVGYLSFENPVNYLDKDVKDIFNVNIYNREAFTVLTTQALLKRKKITYLGINISNFKYLVDIIGFKKSNELLAELIIALQEICGKKNVFRLSSSKFTVLLNNNPKTQNLQIMKIKGRFKNPFKFETTELMLTPLFNMVSSSEKLNSTDTMLELLENSYNSLQYSENDTILTADENIINQQKHKDDLLSILKDSIENNKIEMAYQPIYSVADKKFTACEALIRLRTEDDSFISPDEFIPLAEQKGLMQQLAFQAASQVSHFIATSNILEKGIKKMGMNLSPSQCIQEDLHTKVFNLMKKYNVNPNVITMEVHESTLLTAKNVFKTCMEKMQEQGIKFTVDAYGTGISYFTNLITYKFDFIKLDRSLIQSSMTNDKAKIILQQTIKMLKEMNLTVSVCGIETESQAKDIIEMGVDYIQGYYYSKPLSADDLCKLLDKQN